MFDTLSARYAQRPGGYTRVVKLGVRAGDAASVSLVELVDQPGASGDTGKKKKSPRRKAAAKSTDKTGGKGAETPRRRAAAG
jgi:large subunit ribosomal protein L17